MRFFFFLVFLFVFLAAFATGTVFAAEKAKIGTYVVNAGKFDPQSGSYTIDFYLSYVCEHECEPDFEFSNGRAVSIDRLIDMPNEKFYRIQAALQNSVDFRRFPFDSHALTIEIEDKTRTNKELVYVADVEQSGIEDGIQFVGWQLKGWNATVEDHFYKPYGETFSKYVFMIELKRETLSSLLKIIVPVMIIMMLNFFSHFPDPDKITTRILMHSSYLVATVMFHVSVGAQLPPVGYLTVADKFMFVSYIPLGFSMLSAIAILEFSEEKKQGMVKALHHWSGIASFAIWIAGLAVVYITM